MSFYFYAPFSYVTKGTTDHKNGFKREKLYKKGIFWLNEEKKALDLEVDLCSRPYLLVFIRGRGEGVQTLPNKNLSCLC